MLLGKLPKRPRQKRVWVIQNKQFPSLFFFPLSIAILSRWLNRHNLAEQLRIGDRPSL